VQTVPGFAKGLTDGMPKIVQQEGVGGYVMAATFHCICMRAPDCQPERTPYLNAQNTRRLNFTLTMCRLFKGLTPLWARQIPCELIVLLLGCCSHVRHRFRHQMQHGQQTSP
jgi:hypothetical protein